MKISITMIDPDSGKAFDLQMDHQQRIKTTLKVLNENIREFTSFQNIKEVRLKSSGRRVSVDKTYEEAGIYTGAEILLGPVRQKRMENKRERNEQDGE